MSDWQQLGLGRNTYGGSMDEGGLQLSAPKGDLRSTRWRGQETGDEPIGR